MSLNKHPTIIQVNVEVQRHGRKEEMPLKFNESSNTENLQYINTNLPALGQIKMFKQPLTFNIFESISNDSSSHNEYDIKPVIVSNETTLSSSYEDTKLLEA